MPRLSAPLTLSLALALAACPGGGETKKTNDKKVETKVETKVEDNKIDPNTSLSKAVTAIDLGGPIPPEASAVLYAVDGAVLPLACFVKGKGLHSGKDCLAVAKKGDEVYLKGKGTEYLDKLGDPKPANCSPDSGGYATPQTDGGATFDYAVSPKSLARQVQVAPEDSMSERKPSLAAEEIAAITALSKVTGELTISQVIVQDIDGDNNPDKIVSAFQFNPKDTERYNFAGVFVQRAGKWVIAESSSDIKGHSVRATVDLDGDRTQELWVNVNGTDGSGGDRIVQLTADGGKPLGKYSCGA